MIDFTALAAELKADPAKLGYAEPLASGADGSIADLLNAPNAGTVQLAKIAKGDFLLALLPAAQALSAKDAPTQANWDRLLSLACANESIDVGNPGVKAILTGAVQAGLLTAEQATAAASRPGSRAEVLFGVGVIVDHSDVSKALGNFGKIVPPPQEGSNATS